MCLKKVPEVHMKIYKYLYQLNYDKSSVSKISSSQVQNDIASLQEVSTSALMGKIPRNNKMNSSSSKYYENICILIDFVGYATKVSTTTSTNFS